MPDQPTSRPAGAGMGRKKKHRKEDHSYNPRAGTGSSRKHAGRGGVAGATARLCYHCGTSGHLSRDCASRAAADAAAALQKWGRPPLEKGTTPDHAKTGRGGSGIRGRGRGRGRGRQAPAATGASDGGSGSGGMPRRGAPPQPQPQQQQQQQQQQQRRRHAGRPTRPGIATPKLAAATTPAAAAVTAARAEQLEQAQHAMVESAMLGGLSWSELSREQLAAAQDLGFTEGDWEDDTELSPTTTTTTTTTTTISAAAAAAAAAAASAAPPEAPTALVQSTAAGWIHAGWIHADVEEDSAPPPAAAASSESQQRVQQDETAVASSTAAAGWIHAGWIHTDPDDDAEAGAQAQHATYYIQKLSRS
jgi:hypothetical protein